LELQSLSITTLTVCGHHLVGGIYFTLITASVLGKG